MYDHSGKGEDQEKDEPAGDHDSILMHSFGVDGDPVRHMSCAQMIAAALILLFLSQASTPEQKAVGYMQEAVPHWPMENHCFSCHNNGDGARALLLAYRMKYTVPAASLEGTLDWLQKPNEWGQSGTTGFGDEKLARIQFGAALVDALDAGVVSDKNLLPARVADCCRTRRQTVHGKWMPMQPRRPRSPTAPPWQHSWRDERWNAPATPGSTLRSRAPTIGCAAPTSLQS